jgi:hypothetical protein
MAVEQSPIATLDLPLNYVFQFNLTTGEWDVSHSEI